MWAEFIITYALVTHCTPSGRCAPGSEQVPINAEILGKPFDTMRDCVKKAKHDTELLIAGKNIPDYKPGPIVGGYRTFRKPICYPIQK